MKSGVQFFGIIASAAGSAMQGAAPVPASGEPNWLPMSPGKLGSIVGASGKSEKTLGPVSGGGNGASAASLVVASPGPLSKFVPSSPPHRRASALDKPSAASGANVKKARFI